MKHTQVTNAILTTMCVSVRMLFEENAKRCSWRWKVEMGYIYFVSLGFLFHTTASKRQKAELTGSNLHQRTSVPLVADLLDTLEGFSWGCASPEATYLIGKERKKLPHDICTILTDLQRVNFLSSVMYLQSCGHWKTCFKSFCLGPC